MCSVAVDPPLMYWQKFRCHSTASLYYTVIILCLLLLVYKSHKGACAYVHASSVVECLLWCLWSAFISHWCYLSVLYNSIVSCHGFIASVIDEWNEYGELVEWYWQGKLKYSEKNLPTATFTLQIPHGPTWERTQASVVRGWEANHLIHGMALNLSFLITMYFWKA